MRRLLVLSLFYLPFALSAQTQNEYIEGRDELYTNHNPQKALDLFEAFAAKHPDEWRPPYMIGIVYNGFIKDPEKASPYFERAVKLSHGKEGAPLEEMGGIMNFRNRFADALGFFKKAENAYIAAGQGVPDSLKDSRAYTYFKMGDAEKAWNAASDGGWLKTYLAPRTIDVKWKINFAHAMKLWNLEDEKVLRITLPLERSYQKTVSLRIEPSDPSIKTRRVAFRDNRFVELSRGDQPWPETLELTMRVTQNFKNLTARPARLQPIEDQEDPLWFFASDNDRGYHSLDNPEFVALVRRVTASGKTTGEKVDLAMRYLRAHFKYADRIADKDTYEILKSGQGDCGYYTTVAIAMLRVLHVPVRFMYGLYAGFNPPEPHAIIEIYDASTRKWFPHDPQFDELFGIIDPTYITTSVFPSISDALLRADDGIVDVDIMQFYWSGSSNDTLVVNIASQGTHVAQRSMEAAESPLKHSHGGPLLPRINHKP